jgi:hypothetical protein
MSNLAKPYWEVVNWVMRYLKESSHTCISFTTANLKLEGFVDINPVGDVDSRNSTTRFVYILGGIKFFTEFYFLEDFCYFDHRS